MTFIYSFLFVLFFTDPQVPDGYELVWQDQFNGEHFDPNNWVVGSLRDPVTGDLVPGAAGDHLLNDQYAGYITSEDSYLEDGNLVLRNQKRAYKGASPAGDYEYTSSWVMSMHRVHFNKGYVEFRAKFPAGDKVWPALWLIAEDLVWGPEWDMFEYFGYREDVGYDNMGLHLATDSASRIKWSSRWLEAYDEKFDCTDWHIYGFEWTDEAAVWTIDGKVYRRLSASEIELWPDEEMYLVLNNGQRTESPDNNTTWPNHLIIDYVKLYQKK